MIYRRTEPPAIGAPELKRNITYFETTAITIGLVIGSGIFLKPGAVLVHAGSPAGAILAWIAAGLVTLCAALSISEIAARLPQVGGLYVYLSELYGETWGFLYGWAQTMISSPGSVAALAIAFVKLGAHFFPFGVLEQKLLAISLIAFTVMTQIIGTKLSVVLQTLSTMGKLLPLATLIVLGLIKGKAGGFHFSGLSDPAEGAGFGLAMLGALWAYDGWINAATLGGEVIEPEKKLPRGIITGVLTVMAVYTLFNIILFKVFSADEVAASPQAGVDAAVVLFGARGGALIIAGVMISVFGALSGQIMAGSRIAFAMGGRKLIPCAGILCTVHSKLRTPIAALLFQGAMSIFFVLTGTFETLTNMVIFVLWIFYTMGIGAIFWLKKKSLPGPRQYRVPVYPLTPILGILGGLFFMFCTIKGSLASSLIGLALALMGFPIYKQVRQRRLPRS